jgi:hypothetical protein
MLTRKAMRSATSVHLWTELNDDFALMRRKLGREEGPSRRNLPRSVAVPAIGGAFSCPRKATTILRARGASPSSRWAEGFTVYGVQRFFIAVAMVGWVGFVVALGRLLLFGS